MSRKNPNIINVPKAIAILEDGYGLDAKVFNVYQIRIRQEESDAIFDWFHTTGSLTMVKEGMCRKVGVEKEAEGVAILIKKLIYIKD